VDVVSYALDSSSRIGAIVATDLVDIQRACRLFAGSHDDRKSPSTFPSDIQSFLEAGLTTATFTEEAVESVANQASDRREELLAIGVLIPLDAVKLLPLVPKPGKFLCVAHNYPAHLAETGRPAPACPGFFTRVPESLIAHGDPILRPRVSHCLDWEGELAVVVGSYCRNVAPEDAFDVVAGYTLFNDVSVRDFQRRSPHVFAGKNFFRTGPLGPHLIPKALLPDPGNATISVRLNGDVVQESSIGAMTFSIPELIAYLTEITPLSPGDIIATGTPAGVGARQDPPRYLRPGDTIRVELIGFAVLENPVVDEAPAGSDSV
jgi:2-keto-4-pentenoate hydratase/2-oxohepta-3-ene-1,7-dioic acid hydratase in catechol pathway